MKRLLAAAMCCAATTAAAIAQETPVTEPITIGVSHLVSTHDAERRINVLLPHGYDETDESYPVVFVLDGGAKQDLFLSFGIDRWNQLWGRSQPAIFVGIETVDRQRELLPPTADAGEMERYSTAGEADTFRTWLASEIMPMVEARYRGNGRTYLIGESAAGHFVAETWVKEPELFEGYAALSPSMQWNGQSLSREFASLPPRKRPPMYFSLADEGGATEEGALRFVEAANPSLCFADRRGTHVRHSNTFHQLLPQALQFLLPSGADWLEEYGFVVDCDPAV